MIDRKARDKYAQAIRALVAGMITNDEFEDERLPALDTADPAISAIKSHVARWVLFLKTDVPYEWPELSGKRFFALALANVLTFGYANRFYEDWFKQQGEADVWPFVRYADYAAALECPVYLAGAHRFAG